MRYRPISPSEIQLHAFRIDFAMASLAKGNELEPEWAIMRRREHLLPSLLEATS